MRLKHIHAGLQRRLTSFNVQAALRTRRTAAVLALVTLTALMQAGSVNAAGSRDGGTAPMGTVPTAAQSLSAPGQDGLGAVPNPAAISSARVQAASPRALPASVDLSQDNPPVGNQGGVNSCVAWATGYYLRGWYANRDGYYPAGGSGGTGSYEPMYTYAQIVKGKNNGTTFAANLNIQQSQGIDTRADYWQGDYDYTDQPATNETVNAAVVKVASYNDVSNGGGTSLQTWIENSLAAGNPVAVMIPVYPEFRNVSGPGWLVTPPLPGETSSGNHALFGSKYDTNGLWIENSWGTGYGNNGYSELSWSFINQYAFEAVNIVPSGNGLVSGYVWANSPTTSSYTPSAAYQFNSTGGTNTISRSGAGSYTVAFPNLGILGGTALATAYGPGNATCAVAGWGPAGTAQDVNVRCFNSSGAPADSEFTLAFDRPQSAAYPVAYVWANSPTSSSYTPSTTYQFNSSGAANTITRLGTGSYAVLLPNLGGAFGHVEVTTYGTGSDRCKVVHWGPTGTAQQVNVNCFTSGGAAADSMFTMTYARSRAIDGGPAAGSAHVWANQPTTASYTPDMSYQFNSTGATDTMTRLGTGAYAVTLPGQNLNVGDVQVTAYGSGSDACMVVSWTPSSGVRVNCYTSTGAAADSDFDMSFVNS